MGEKEEGAQKWINKMGEERRNMKKDTQREKWVLL